MSCGTRAQDSARAILMALGSSVLPSEPITCQTGTAYCLHCWVLRMAAPDHCGPPGPVVSPVAVLQQPWLRNSTTAPSCALQLRTAAWQFVSAGPF